MASKAKIIKALKEPKYSTRRLIRCFVCGRKRSTSQEWQLCRLHLRQFIDEGLLPGFKKASW